VATRKLLISDAVKFTQNSVYAIVMKDPRGNKKCMLYLSKFMVKPHNTFVNIIKKVKLNIVPIFAIDFSLSNLALDGSQMVGHTLKKGITNDYYDCLNDLMELFKPYADYILPYGFGAKTIAREDVDTCHLFALTGDYEDPFVDDLNQLKACYNGTVKTI